MYNPNRGTLIEAAVMGLAGVVIGSFVLEATTDMRLELRTTVGAIYGLVAYLAWWIFITCCGSLFYDKNDEPEQIDVLAAITSFCIAIPVLFFSTVVALVFLYSKIRAPWSEAK